MTDQKGNTALHLACAASDTESVRLFVVSGIYLNSYNADGETPYLMSFNNQYYGEPIRNLLAAAGAEIPETEIEEPQNPELPFVITHADPPPVEPSFPEVSVPEPMVANAEPVTVSDLTIEQLSFSVRFSWPKITPSKVKGWSNRDKITGNAVLLLQYAGSFERVFTEALNIPLKGVNGEAYYTDRNISLEPGRELRGSLIIETQRGRKLIASVIGDNLQNDRLDFYFSSFVYQ